MLMNVSMSLVGYFYPSIAVQNSACQILSKVNLIRVLLQDDLIVLQNV